MRILIVIFFLGFLQNSMAQFTNTFVSFPDSSRVLMNGVEQCYTPCKVRYYWKNRVDNSIVFSVESPNHETWEKVISTKPLYFDSKDFINLKKAYPSLKFENIPIIAFDKIRVELENGDIVGVKIPLKGGKEDIKWSGSIKVGDESFEKIFYRTATNMGFDTPISESSKLFSEESNKKRLPKYIVGVEISKYYVQYREVNDNDFKSGHIKGLTKIDFNWKVLDKKSGKVALSKSNSSSFKFRGRSYDNSQTSTEVFELALIDFLSSKEFTELVESGDFQYVNDTSKEMEEHVLEKIDLPEFKSFSELIQQVNPACVSIITDGGHGSGVIISESGLLLSAYHVIEGVNQIDVKLPSGITLPAKVLSFDEESDVVLLDIQGGGFSPLSLSKSENFQLGGEVFTIGTPADIDLGQTISKGILSGKRKREGKIFLQVDMSISPGNSGGPLINEKGEVIGIVQSKIIGEGVEGIGFAYSIDQVIKDLNLVLK